MKPEIVYEYVQHWLDVAGTQHLEFNIKCVPEMKELIELCRKEMLDNQAKASGTKTVCAAAKRIIKSAKAGNREFLYGMFPNTLRDGSTVWCVCDGYHAVRFKDKMDLDEVDAKFSEKLFDMGNIVCKPDGAFEIELPNIVDVKLASKNKTSEKDKTPKKFCLNAEHNIWVNPQYLLNMMGCLPDCKAYATSSIGTIYFEAENGDGVLLPVRPPKE